jgi:E3 ubiquitin-protein ligase UBR2
MFVEYVISSPENGHSSDTDAKNKEKIRVMEEFLHLLIIIVSERYEPGIGNVNREQKLTREVIHQLCISPMAHSELVRSLQDCGQLESVRYRYVHAIVFHGKNMNHIYLGFRRSRKCIERCR